MKHTWWSLLIAVVPGSILAQDRKFDPTADYHKETILGFNVLVHPEVQKRPDEAREMRKELESQLQSILRVVPDEPIKAIKKVPIWVEWEKKKNGAAEFHPSKQWLTANGYNPEKTGAVELNNAKNFVKWSRDAQPWMVLHEMAHAYHFLVLTPKHEGIEAAYKQAIDRKLYDSVAYINGGKRKAYATTDSKEYFAELSEAYFGKNDFYPFNRTELEKHDPVGFQVLEKVWGKPKADGEKKP